MSTPGKIYSLIPKIMADIGVISKNRENSHQKYMFRGVEDFYNAIQPALIKQGVFCCPQVLDTQASEITNESTGKTSYRILLRIAHRFYADDGSYVEVVTQGEGIDTSDKASNKAMSAAMKYAFIELFSIPTVEVDDSDDDSPEAGKTKTQALNQKFGGGQARNGGFSNGF